MPLNAFFICFLVTVAAWFAFSDTSRYATFLPFSVQPTTWTDHPSTSTGFTWVADRADDRSTGVVPTLTLETHQPVGSAPLPLLAASVR